MKIVRSRLDFEDANRSWEGSVEGAVKIFLRNGRSKREAGHLAERVDAGVSPARTLG